MVKITNILGDELSGTVGKTRVYAKWKGIQYGRKYVKPSNPNTPAQQEVRNSFKNAVDKTHTWNSLQKKAYEYMASGQAKTWFNVFIGRWQKMTTAQRAAYVDPYFGFKQIGNGAATTGGTDENVTDTKALSLSHKPIVLGSLTYTKGSGSFDPVAIVEVNRGRIDFLKSATGAVTVSYTSGGATITDEAVASSPAAGTTVYLKNMNVNAHSVHVKVAGTEVDAAELDVLKGTIYVCNLTTFTGGSTFTYSYYTPVSGVTMAAVKAATNFSTFKGYSDSNGIIETAETAEDGDKDITYSMSGFLTQVTGNVSASKAAQDEYIALIAS